MTKTTSTSPNRPIKICPRVHAYELAFSDLGRLSTAIKAIFENHAAAKLLTAHATVHVASIADLNDAVSRIEMALKTMHKAGPGHLTYYRITLPRLESGNPSIKVSFLMLNPYHSAGEEALTNLWREAIGDLKAELAMQPWAKLTAYREIARSNNDYRFETCIGKVVAPFSIRDEGYLPAQLAEIRDQLKDRSLTGWLVHDWVSHDWMSEAA